MRRHPSRFLPLISMVAVLAAVHAAPGKAVASTFDVLYDFTGSQDGWNTSSALVEAPGGSLFGTTYIGGTGCASYSGCGTVFALTPPVSSGGPWTHRILHSFTGPPDGWTPSSIVRDASGALYVTASTGGPVAGIGNGCGAIFELTPPAAGATAWAETLLYAFTCRADGAGPDSLVAGPGGVLYGTAFAGTAAGYGTVFQLTRPAAGGVAWSFRTLYAFKGGGDGTSPGGLVVGAGGSLYGITLFDGAFRAGTVFQLLPPPSGSSTWQKRTLYTFTGGADGALPNVHLPNAPLLLDRNGALYGTTFLGGAHGAGTVFKLTPPAAGRTAWTQSVLHNFGDNAADAGSPNGDLVADARGALYGTSYGVPFTANPSIPGGAIFKLTPPPPGRTRWSATIARALRGYDGEHPNAGLTIDPSGALLGTTSTGGLRYGYGTIFKLQLP